MIRALDCRYVGQGYELRVTLDDGPFTEAALEQFHRLHEREYGSAYGDPIEIVNARVTAIGKRPTLRRAAGRERHASSEALVGESEGHFRVDGQLQALHDALLRPRAAPARRGVRRARRSSSTSTRRPSSRPAGARAPTAPGTCC